MQNFGGAILLASAETIFSSQLVADMRKYAPDASAAAVEAAGASGLRQVVPAAQLGNVLKAYNAALVTEFYLAIGCTGAMLLICWGMGWNNIAKAESQDHELEDKSVE